MSFTKTASLLLLGATLALSSCGSNPDAARLSSAARAVDGEAQGLYNAAAAAEQAGKTGKAIKGYEKIARNYPMSPVAAEAQFRLSRLLQNEGDLEDAFESYDEFLKNYPASPHYSEAMNQQRIIAHGAADGTIKDSYLGFFNSPMGANKTAKMLAKVRDNAPRSTSAEKAQYTIGAVYEREKMQEKAIAAYRTLVKDYPLSSYAPEAQFRVGKLLQSEVDGGNQDSANLSRARDAFEDLLISYPNCKRAGDARREIAKLASGDIQHSYDIGEFYRKKGQNKSAIVYYKEVLRIAKPGPLRNQAAARIAELGGQ